MTSTESCKQGLRTWQESESREDLVPFAVAVVLFRRTQCLVDEGSEPVALRVQHDDEQAGRAVPRHARPDTAIDRLEGGAVPVQRVQQLPRRRHSQPAGKAISQLRTRPVSESPTRVRLLCLPHPPSPRPELSTFPPESLAVEQGLESCPPDRRPTGECFALKLRLPRLPRRRSMVAASCVLRATSYASDYRAKAPQAIGNH